ncbi:uncharacterized protein LOC115581568 [Sparus aurata]|uniref:uncharacterized protein LOC115581568 n=1 Tax=Sparus aurata TaxID=8175 RepID=UPI0011C1A795|nr:uncharacterized protein LOC115581568 [Sparus aurata]
MPQTGMNYEGRRRGTRRSTCKANGLAPGADLVNGAVVHNGYPAAATRTNETTPAGTLNGTKPQCMVNGYINHKYKSRNASPPRTLRKHGSTIPAVSDASTAGRVNSADNSGGISVNGAASLDTVASHCYSDQMAPEPSLSAGAKNRRRWKKCGRKKRPPTLPPQEQEDWESEIQEVTVPDWEKMCFGVRPYGPEDVLHFALRDLRLRQTQTADLPLTANYRPALHHPRPVKWSCYSIPTEPDQFADADE